MVVVSVMVRVKVVRLWTDVLPIVARFMCLTTVGKNEGMVPGHVENHFVRMFLVIAQLFLLYTSKDGHINGIIAALNWVEHFKLSRVAAPSCAYDVFAHRHRSGADECARD